MRLRREEFAEASLRFFELVKKRKYIILISEITLAELSGAPDNVRQVHTDLPSDCIEELSIGEEVNELHKPILTQVPCQNSAGAMRHMSPLFL